MKVDGGVAHLVDRVLRRRRERDLLVPGFNLSARDVSAASRRARAQATRGRRAGVVSRLLVAGVDFVVVTVLLFGLFVAFGGRSLPARRRLRSTFRTPGPCSPASAIRSSSSCTWPWRGRSPAAAFGKQLFGLRVDPRRRRRARPLAARARARRGARSSASRACCGPAVSTRNAAVHDIVFRTAVVYDWAEVAGGPEPAALPALDRHPQLRRPRAACPTPRRRGTAALTQA